MYRLTATYHQPDDLDAFVNHYRDTHAKLAAKLPDLRAFTWGTCETGEGGKPVHALVAVLDWDTKEAAEASLSSAEGQAAVGDLGNFAQAGVDMEFQEVVKEV